MFDRDCTGTLSFDEFFNTIVMMNQIILRHSRIEYLIHQNNTDRHQEDDGLISAQYGHQVFRRLNDYHGLPTGREHQYWKYIDQKNRGYVTQEEFINYISQHPNFNRKLNTDHHSLYLKS